MEARPDPRIPARDPSGPTKAASLRSGDVVRLKFMYPGLAVEVLDCTWVGVVGIGPDGAEAPSPWVTLDFQGRRIWKPLGYLVQVELLEEATDAAPAAQHAPATPRTDLGYHR